MKSAISRSCAAKADTWCAPVATGAKKIPLGKKKTFYICSGVMHESCNEWKLMKIEVIHGLTLVKCKNLMQNWIIQYVKYTYHIPLAAAKKNTLII